MIENMKPLSITGYSLVNACGIGHAATLNAIKHNQTGLNRQAYRDLTLPTWLGKVSGVDEHRLDESLANFDCRNNRLANMALAIDDIGDQIHQVIDQYGADRIGVFVGTSTSGIEETEKVYEKLAVKHADIATQYDFLATHNLASLLVFIQKRLGISGVGQTISTACSSSAKVFAAAHRHIHAGLCDAAIVGGVDSLCNTTLYGFDSLQLISDDICRPYDAHRKGINIGEAAGFVILERVNNARGKVKLKGYGESSDAYHMSSPHPDGKGAVIAMREALMRAGLAADEINYINLHGTGTQNNDMSEGRGIYQVFGDRVNCSSTKGYVGHTLGAAGITEAIISIMALESGVVPGNINLHNVDKDIPVQPLLTSKKMALGNVMSNNFGFGGSNCSLIFGW